MSTSSHTQAHRLPAIGDFVALTGETFTLGAGEGAMSVRLSEVTSLGWNRPAECGGCESFSLVFHAAATVRIPQGIYDFTHPRLGTEAMFLVPIGPDAQGMRLQVIFNFN